MESIIVINRVCAASSVVAVWLAVQQDIKHWRRQSPLEDMYQHSRCSYDFCMHFYNAVNCDDDFQREREWVEGGGQDGSFRVFAVKGKPSHCPMAAGPASSPYVHLLKHSNEEPNSKHWFTTSFRQPLSYLVTSQVPENCLLTSSCLLVLTQ